MEYIDPTLIVKNAAQSYVVREFKANDLFDPDPLLGGGSYSGYNVQALKYSRNIVTHLEVEMSIENLEPAAILNAYIIFRDIQPSLTITSYNAAVSSAEVAPRTIPLSMGVSTGNSKAVIKGKIPLAAILGRPLEYLTDTGYAANSNSSPPQSIWMALVVFSYSPVSLIPNGVSAIMSLWATTNWFSGMKVLDKESNLYKARERYYQRVVEESAVVPDGYVLVPDSH